MDEHPVALATVSRSPTSWVSSLRYGVSPQPEQAPENSKSGSSSCEPLIEAGSTSVRSSSGSDSKNSQSRRASSREASAGSISREQCTGSVFEKAGQAVAQSLQPVQSSGETAITSCLPGRSLPRQGLLLKPAGACASSSGSQTLIRIAACGQTSAHLAQSMQIDGSQTGSSSASARRS